MIMKLSFSAAWLKIVMSEPQFVFFKNLKVLIHASNLF